MTANKDPANKDRHHRVSPPIHRSVILIDVAVDDFIAAVLHQSLR